MLSTESDDISDDESEIIISICKVCNVEVNINDIQSHLNFHKKNRCKKPNNESNSKARSYTTQGNVEAIRPSLDDSTEATKGPGDFSKNDNGGFTTSTSIVCPTNDKDQWNNTKIIPDLIPSTSKGPDEIGENSNNDLDLPPGIIKKDKLGKVLLCQPCNVEIDRFNNALTHSKAREHIQRLNAFRNGIIRIDKLQYLCTICNWLINGLNGIEEHLKNVEHERNALLNLDSMASNKNQVEENFSEPVLPDGFIKMATGFFCEPCKAEFAAYENAFSHSLSADHKTQLVLFPKGIVRTDKVPHKCIFCNCALKDVVEAGQHVESLMHKMNATMANETVDLTSTKEIDENKSDNEQDLPLAIIKKGKRFCCEACNVQVSSYHSITEHVKSKKHKNRLGAFHRGIMKIKGKKHKCTVCNCLLIGSGRVTSHLESAQHRYNVNSRTAPDEPSTVLDKSNVIPGGNDYVSTLHLPNSPSISKFSEVSSNAASLYNISKQIISEETSITKKIATEPTAMELSNSEEIIFAECKICNWVILGDPVSLQRHVTTEVHILNQQAVTPSIDRRNIVFDANFTFFEDIRFFLIESNIESDANLIKVLKVPLNNIINATETFYWCNSCEIKLSDTPRFHLLSEPHLEVLHGIKRIIGSHNIICRTCNNTTFISPGGIMNHINGSVHQMNLLKNLQPEMKSTKIDFQSVKQYFPRNNLPDGIVTIANQPFFLCTLCNIMISDLTNVDKHAQDVDHKRHVKKNFVIQLRERMFACLVCFELICNLKSLEEHLNDSIHQGKYNAMDALNPADIVTKLLAPLNILETNEYICMICDIRISRCNDVVMLLEHTFDQGHQSRLINSWSPENIVQSLSSSIPSSMIPRPLAVQKRDHNTLENDTISTDGPPTKRIMVCNVSKLEGIERFGQKRMFCTICNCWISRSDSVEDHVATVDHITNGPRVIQRNKYAEFDCIVCNLKMCDVKELTDHLRDVKHLSNKAMKFPPDPKTESQKLYDLPDGLVRVDYDTRFRCEVCSKMVTGTLKHAIIHANSNKHEQLQRKRRMAAGENVETLSQISTVGESTSQSTSKISELVLTVPSELPKADEIRITVNEKYGLAENYIKNPSLISSLPEGIERLKKKLFCTLCNSRITKGQSIDDHIVTIDHLTNGPKVIHCIEKEEFECELCECKLLGYEHLSDHLKDTQHWYKKSIKFPADPETEAMRLSDLPEGLSRVKYGPRFLCNPCYKVIPLEQLTFHVKLKKHLKKLQQWREKNSCGTLLQTPIHEISEKTSPLASSSSSINTQDSTVPMSLNLSEPEKATASIVKEYGTAEQYINDYNLAQNLPDGIEWLPDMNILYCTICCCRIKKTMSIDDHIATIDHRTRGPKVIHSTGNEGFKCQVCDCKIRNYPVLVHHLREIGHISKKAAKFPVDPEVEKENRYSLPEGLRRVYNNNRFWCELCSTWVTPTLQHALNHIEMGKHKKNLGSRRMNDACTSIKKSSETVETATSISSSEIENEDAKSSTSSSHLENQASSALDINKYGLAKKYINHRVLAKHLPAGIERFSNKKSLFCTICNCTIRKTQSIDDHIAEIDHVNNAPKVIHCIGGKDFHCEVCDCQITSKSVRRHLRDVNHWLNKSIKFPGNSKTELYELPVGLFRVDYDSRYRCKVCSKMVGGTLKNALDHVRLRKHQMRLKSWLRIYVCETNAQTSEVSLSEELVDQKTTTARRMISTFRITEDDVSTSTDSKRHDQISQVLQTNNTHSVCNICNVVIPGADWNLMAHRNTKLHKKNEVQLNCSPSTPINTDVKLETQNNQLPPSKSIPHEKMMEIHFIGPIIDSIECNVCHVQIRETQGISVYQNYADHIKSSEHETKEVEFIKDWNAISSSIKNVSKKESRSQRRPRKSTVLSRKNKKKIMCSFCDAKMEFIHELHAHITSHFYSRFDKNSKETVENAQVSDPFHLDLLDLTKKPEKPPRKQQTSIRQNKPLDIDINDGMNIYEVNKQKKEDLQLGVLLTFSIDHEKLYCLVCRKTIINSIQILYEHLCSIDHLDYLQQMIEDHRMFKDYPCEFSNLALGYEYMEEKTDSLIKCHACGIQVSNDTSSLNEHLKDTVHVERWAAFAENAKPRFTALSSRMHCDFYSVKYYWCVPCKSQFSTEIQFRRHLYNKKHLKQINKFKDISEELIFDYCAVCAALWFGFLRTFGYHSKCSMHKQHAGQTFYLASTLPVKAERLLSSPGDNISELLEKINNLQAADEEKNKIVLHDLQIISKDTYPNCVAHIFGSRVSGLAARSSDIDIFLDCSTKMYSVYEGHNSSLKEVQERVQAINNCLEKQTKSWLINRVILDARVPIIKALHWPTGINCDITFTNGLSVENTKLVKNYCEKFHNCRRMIVFLRNWMSHCELSSVIALSNYSIAMMVIFFLQLKGILPSVAQLIDHKKQSRLISGWETGVDSNFEVIDIGESIERLLAGFFGFYANFDYRTEVICPLLGRSVKKIDFQKRLQLPAEMKLYNLYLESTKNPNSFRIDSPLCIQDPFELSHNLTQNVDKSIVYRLKSFCSLSAQILEND